MDITKASRDINELNPVAQQACRLFLDECKKAGLDIFITEAYRSQARQNYLYEQGRTRPGQKVTWTRSSNHTGRMAWDIAVNPPKNLYDTATLKKAGAIANRLGITWGGDWKGTPDMPHFEVKASWKAPKQSSPVANEKTIEKEKTEQKEEVRMYKPSNSTMVNATAVVLKRLEEKENGISPVHRENLLKGQLKLDDAIALLYVAKERGLL